MSIELSNEAFTLLYFLRERLSRCQQLIASDPKRAEQELAEAIEELGGWIGPGVP
jgi:hypothetical protein